MNKTIPTLSRVADSMLSALEAGHTPEQYEGAVIQLLSPEKLTSKQILAVHDELSQHAFYFLDTILDAIPNLEIPRSELISLTRSYEKSSTSMFAVKFVMDSRANGIADSVAEQIAEPVLA